MGLIVITPTMRTKYLADFVSRVGAIAIAFVLIGVWLAKALDAHFGDKIS